METDKPAEAEAKAGDAAEGAAEGSEAAKKEAPKVEPSSYSLANPCRVTPSQAKHVAFKSDSRWGAGRDAAPGWDSVPVPEAMTVPYLAMRQYLAMHRALKLSLEGAADGRRWLCVC
jgi:hypothetical protein